MDLRAHIANAGTKLSIEGNFGLPVILIDPDGVTYDTNEDGAQLKGQVLYDRDNELPESGDDLVVFEHRITLRKKALSRIPKAGEKWIVKYPLDSTDPSTLSTYFMSEKKAPIDGSSIGFITIFPGKLIQS